MRADLKMNDQITITFPAHVWAAVETWYRAIEPASWAMLELCAGIERALIDPVWYKGRHATQVEEMQAQNPVAQMARFLGVDPSQIQRLPLRETPCPECGLVVCVCPEGLGT
jgi:hypothetical protein